MFARDQNEKIPTMRKIVVATAFGPLAQFPAFILFVIYYIIFDGQNPREPLDTFGYVMGYVGGGLFYAYQFTLFYGLPAGALLKRLNFFSLPTVLLVSVIPIGLIGAFFPVEIEMFIVLGYASLSISLGCWFFYKWA